MDVPRRNVGMFVRRMFENVGEGFTAVEHVIRYDTYSIFVVIREMEGFPVVFFVRDSGRADEAEDGGFRRRGGGVI